MALVQKQLTGKKQAILTLSMIAVLAVTGLVFYFGIFKKGQGAPPTSLEDVYNAPVKVPASRSSLDVLDSLKTLPDFTKLKQFGRWPLSLEPVGNPEPFKAPSQSIPSQSTRP